MLRSIFLILSLILMTVAGCVLPTRVTGSGKTVNVERDFTGFRRVEVGSAFALDITQSEAYSVVITIDDNLKQYLEVSQRGDTLKINLKPGLSFNLGRNTLQVAITLPELTGLELSGATRGAISGFKSEEDLDIDVSGASTLRGDITAGDVRLTASGASTVTLTGAGQTGRLNVSGASQLKLADFALTDVDADASGASQITLNASGKLDASASGASRIHYTGNPQVKRADTSGASTISGE